MRAGKHNVKSLSFFQNQLCLVCLSAGTVFYSRLHASYAYRKIKMSTDLPLNSQKSVDDRRLSARSVELQNSVGRSINETRIVNSRNKVCP